MYILCVLKIKKTVFQDLIFTVFFLISFKVNYYEVSGRHIGL